MNYDTPIALTLAAVSVLVWLFICQRQHVRRQRNKRG